MMVAPFLIGVLFVALADSSNVPGSKDLGGDSVDAKIGELPSFAVVINKTSGEMISSGLLIKQQVVLTLGSSLIGTSPEDLCVVFGVNNKTDGQVDGQTVNVAEIALHPGLSKSTAEPVEGDVALVKLEQPVQRSRYVQPFGVENVQGKNNQQRKQGRSKRSSKLPTRCLIYGFPRNGNLAPPTVESLKRFTPHLKDEGNCEYFAYQTRFPWNRRSWYCSVRDDFANTCSGIGGEPLLCGSRRRGFELRGLVPRRTPDYCYGGFTVYTRMPFVYPWIAETLVAMTAE